MSTIDNINMFIQDNNKKFLWTFGNIRIYVNSKGVTGKRKAFDADKKNAAGCLLLDNRMSYNTLINDINSFSSNCIAVDGIDRILGDDSISNEQVITLLNLLVSAAIDGGKTIMLLVKDDGAFNDVETIICTAYKQHNSETDNSENIDLERVQISAVLEARGYRVDTKTGAELTEEAQRRFNECADELENIITNTAVPQEMSPPNDEEKCSVEESEVEDAIDHENVITGGEESDTENSPSVPNIDDDGDGNIADEQSADNYISLYDAYKNGRLSNKKVIVNKTPTKNIPPELGMVGYVEDQHRDGDQQKNITKKRTRNFIVFNEGITIVIPLVLFIVCVIVITFLFTNSNNHKPTETSSDGSTVVSAIVVEVSATDDDGNTVDEDTVTSQGIISVLNAEHENPYHGLLTLYLNIGVEFADYSGSAYTEGYILQVSAGDIINLPCVYAKDDYTFIGWSQGGVPEEPIWDMFTEQVQMTDDISGSKSTVIHALYMDDEGNGYCSCGAYAEGVYADKIEEYKANYAQYLAEAAEDETQAASAEDE